MSEPKPHPIVDHVLLQLQEKKDESFEFKPGGVEKMKELILKLGEEEWITAGQDLTMFAYYLDQQAKSPKPAEQILVALEVLAPRVQKEREKVAAGSEEAAQRGEKFAEFTGPAPEQSELGKKEDQVPLQKLHRGPMKG